MKKPIAAILLLYLALTGMCRAQEAGYESALTQAIKNNDVAAVQALIASGAQVVPGIQVDQEERKAQEPSSEDNSSGTDSSEESSGDTDSINSTDEAPDFDDPNQVAPLIYAAGLGNVAIVKVLIEAGAKVNYLEYSTHGGCSVNALKAAIYYDHIAVIKLLAKSGADLNHQSQPIRTPLIIAAGLGYVASIRALIEAGADVNYEQKENDDYATALMAAAGEGNPEAIKALLKAGAQLDTQDNDGYTALHHSMYHPGNSLTADQIAAARILLEAGASTTIANKSGDTVLSMVLGQPYHPALLKLLITYDPTIYSFTKNSRSLIMYLLTKKQNDTVNDDYLSDAGVLNALLTDPKTPFRVKNPTFDVNIALHNCMLRGACSTMLNLVQRTVPAMLADKRFLVMHKGHMSPLKYKLLSSLVQHSLLNYLKSPKASVAIEMARLENHNFMCPKTIHLSGHKRTADDKIIAAPCSGYTRNAEYNQTMLMWAALCGHTHAIKSLTTQAPDFYVTAKDHWGFTALMYAVIAEHDQAVKLLLAHSAIRKATNVRSSDNYTALDYAAQTGNLPIIIALLEAGASISSHTVWMASLNGHDLLAAHLLIEKISISNKTKLRLLKPEEA